MPLGRTSDIRGLQSEVADAIGVSLVVKAFPPAASIDPNPLICESDREGPGSHLVSVSSAPQSSEVSAAGRISDYYLLRAEEAIGNDLRAKEGGDTVHTGVPETPQMWAPAATRMLHADNEDADPSSPIAQVGRRNMECTDARSTKNARLGGGDAMGRVQPAAAGGRSGNCDVAAAKTIASVRKSFEAGGPMIGGFLCGMEMCLPVALANLYPSDVALRAIVGGRRMGPYTMRQMSRLTGLEFCLEKSGISPEGAYLLVEDRVEIRHCAGLRSGSAVCVMYDSECPHALTCDLSAVSCLGDLEVYRVSAAPLDGRRLSPCEYLPTGCHIGGQRRKVEAETTTPLYSGSSAEQIYTDSDSECVSASSALPPLGQRLSQKFGPSWHYRPYFI